MPQYHDTAFGHVPRSSKSTARACSERDRTHAQLTDRAVARLMAVLGVAACLAFAAPAFADDELDAREINQPLIDQFDDPAEPSVLDADASAPCPSCCPKFCRLDCPEWRRMGCTLGQQLTYRCQQNPCASFCSNRCWGKCDTCPRWLESKLMDPCSHWRLGECRIHRQRG